MKRYLNKIFLEKPIYYPSWIIGIPLIIIGIIFFYNPTNLNLKIGGITLIIIGTIIVLLITKKTKSHIMDFYIILGTIIIILVFFFFSGLDRDGLFIVIFIELLILKEVLEEHTSFLFKQRMNILFLIFLLFFLIIVGIRILSILKI